ncbi:MAG: globin [Deltaproteobacteria bacterium]|nr:globin [Deltaproteobacteria bacterium]
MTAQKSPPPPVQTLLERLGGADGIQRWVDRFYDKVPENPVLAPLFPPDLTVSREKQHAYFIEFFGGPPLYSQTFGRPFMRYLHRNVRIGQTERDAWLNGMMAALKAEQTDSAVLAAVEDRLGPMATQMINHHPERKDSYFFN